MQVEYTLDQWEWQGVTRSIDIDPSDYTGMSDGEIKSAVYAEIRRDAEQNLHLVYAEDEVLAEVREAEASENEEADDDD